MQTGFMNSFNQVMKFEPATEMNDGKKQEKSKRSPKQTAKHYDHENDGRACPGLESFFIQGHIRTDDLLMEWNLQHRYRGKQLWIFLPSMSLKQQLQPN